MAVAFIAGPALTSARPASADQLQSAQAQAAQIAAQIQAQGNQLDVLSENYDQDQIRVQQLDQQRAQTQAQVDQTEAQVSAARASLRQLAIQTYTSGSSSDDLEELFAPSGERSAAVQEYQQVASESVSGAIDHLNQTESVLNAQQSTLATTESQARATLAAAQVAKQSAASELASQQATLSKVKGNIATLVAQRQAAIAAAQAAAFQARVQAAQRAAAQQAAQQAAQSQRTVGSGASVLVAVPAVPGGGGAEAVAAAESQIGVPYVWAGATPGVGFDCSGLTMWAWAHAGVSLAHSAAAQYDESVHIPLSDLQPGDLLFYDEGGTIGHVTMYVGPGEMVQAMETGTNIQITGIWTSGLVGAGRP